MFAFRRGFVYEKYVKYVEVLAYKTYKSYKYAKRTLWRDKYLAYSDLRAQEPVSSIVYGTGSGIVKEPHVRAA
jgi:hypothetical protein